MSRTRLWINRFWAIRVAMAQDSRASSLERFSAVARVVLAGVVVGEC